MYLHSQTGFYEIDLHDGARIPVRSHMENIKPLIKAGLPVFVIRARDKQAIDLIVNLIRVSVPFAFPFTPKTFKSPPGWDYEYRTYLPLAALSVFMTTTINSIDYRNFKAHTKRHAPREYDLAHGIWTEAFKHAKR